MYDIYDHGHKRIHSGSMLTQEVIAMTECNVDPTNSIHTLLRQLDA